MAEHHLKTWPEFFDAIADGRKTFEIRENDREFQVGDTLVLHRFVAGFGPDGGRYTGERLRVVVTYMTEWAQAPGTVVMAIQLEADQWSRCTGVGLVSRSSSGCCEDDPAAFSAAIEAHRRPGDEIGGWFWPCIRRANASSCTAADAEEQRDA